MSLHPTSKDLNSCPSSSFLPSPFWQNLDQNLNLDKQVNSNVNKEFLTENSSQKISPKKFLQKNSAKKIRQKYPLGKFPENFKKKSTEISKIKYKNSKNSPTTFKKIKEKFQTISNPNFKFLRFWKYPIPYIALGGRKPFWACYDVKCLYSGGQEWGREESHSH